MYRLVSIWLLMALITFAIGQKPKTATDALVGTWKYDVSTLRLELNERAKKELNDPKRGKQAREMFQRMKTSLTQTLRTMKVAFLKDHRLVISSSSSPDTLLGTWSIQGLRIKTLMTNVRQQTPQMELSKDGRHIVAVYADPNFGIGRVSLVKG